MRSKSTFNMKNGIEPIDRGPVDSAIEEINTFLWNSLRLTPYALRILR